MDQGEPAPLPISAILRRLLAHFGLRLQLFADTKQLAEPWSKWLDIPIISVPLPVTVSVGQDRPAKVRPNLVFPGGRTENVFRRGKRTPFEG
jgi:hypothetical protein